MELTLIILSFIITLLYNVSICTYYRTIPESLSETSYILGSKNFLFTIYCFIIGLCIMPPLFNITNENLQFIPFIFCGGLIFAGFSPLYKKGLDKKVHYISALIAFITFIVYVIFQMGYEWLIYYLIILGVTCLIKFKSYVYFAELIALFEILIYLIIH